jgi:hypothetical protein
MVDAELLALFLILEYLDQLVDKFESRLRHALVIWTQPDQHVARILVDAVHELDLLASLHRVVLVCAYLIDPETPWPIQLPEPFQTIIEASGEPKASAVADDLVGALRVAPHVREWFVLFRRGDAEELKMAF